MLRIYIDALLFSSYLKIVGLNYCCHCYCYHCYCCHYCCYCCYHFEIAVVVDFLKYDETPSFKSPLVDFILISFEIYAVIGNDNNSFLLVSNLIRIFVIELKNIHKIYYIIQTMCG